MGLLLSMYSPTWQSGRWRGISLLFPVFLQFLKQWVAAVICQALMQFPPTALLTQSLPGGETWLAAATAVLLRQQTSVSNKVIETRDIQTLISSNADGCKLPALTTITAVSVCLFSWSTGALFMQGQVVLLAVLACLYFFAFLITYFWRYLHHDKITYFTEYPRIITASYWVCTHSYPNLPGQNFIRAFKTLEHIKIS